MLQINSLLHFVFHIMNQSDAVLKATTQKIQQAMSDLGRKLKAGDESQLLVWILPGALACAHRPLRHHPKFGGSGRRLPPVAVPLVITWIDLIKKAGIRGIICLMHEKELAHYSDLKLGTANLVDYYRKEGFEICHIPWDDPAHRQQQDGNSFATELEIVREKAEVAFQNLPKPILLHCSAGIDRSSPVAAYIWLREQNCHNTTVKS
ncbi:MAG: hypothetical protein HP491_14435 [Nitrospira sp.]|nr:hypothetical protein [Nitrospira sp.]